MWTSFWDMHSGGGCKEPPFELIFIEASQKEAEIIFYNRFGHNPNRVSCTCCGHDYSIDEEPTLEKSASYHIKSKGLNSLTVFLKEKDVKIIYDSEIKTSERKGSVPDQGYIWGRLKK